MKRVAVGFFSLILICGACGSRQVKGVHNPQMAPAEREAGAFSAFYENFQRGDYKEAADIAKSAGILKSKEVYEIVLVEMFLLVQRGEGMMERVEEARNLSEFFEFSRSQSYNFARVAFKKLLKSQAYDGAANVAYWFKLEQSYLEQAIYSMRADENEGVHPATLLACHFAGSNSLMDRLILEDMADLKSHLPERSSAYALLDVVRLCPLTEAQTREMFELGENYTAIWLGVSALKKAKDKGRNWNFDSLYRRLYYKAIADNEVDDAQALLDYDEFKVTTDDHKALIAKYVELLKCAKALQFSLWKELPNEIFESIVSDKKCAGEGFIQAEFSISEDSVGWLFELAMKYEKFSLARRLTVRFKMSSEAVDSVEQSAMSAKAFDALMEFPPRDGETEEGYRLRMLTAILDENEEWFVVRYMVYLRAVNPDQQTLECRDWIERACIHALFRGEYRMAAEIAGESADDNFKKKAMSLAFEEAMKAENAQDAGMIARRAKLGYEALRRVALLEFKQRQEKERARWREQKRQEELRDANDWKPKRLRY